MLYNFCPKCGGKLTEKVKDGCARLQCSGCSFIFYQNSKPTASVLIMDQNRVLLGKRRIEPAKGKWDVIGGFLEPGEHPEDGAKREALEETGLKVELGEMIGFFMDIYDGLYPTLNICYLAGIAEGDPRPADDIEELKWFGIAEIPENLAFKNGREMLEKLKEWRGNKLE